MSSLRCRNHAADSYVLVSQEKDVDLLLVDSGDLHDGTQWNTLETLSLRVFMAAVNRHWTFGRIHGGRSGCARRKSTEPCIIWRSNPHFQSNKFMMQLPYDIMAIGKCVRR